MKWFRHYGHICHFMEREQNSIIINGCQLIKFKPNMGNYADYCCDHNAELRLFDQSQRIITNHEPNPQRALSNAPPTKNYPRIFSRDDVSIIDQLDIKSETVKEDLFLPFPSDKTLRTTFEKENTQHYSRQQSMAVERKWEQFKNRELQQEKRRQTDLIRREVEKQLKMRKSLRHKKKESDSSQERPCFQRPKSTSYPQKQCDFQFIVNYR